MLRNLRGFVDDESAGLGGAEPHAGGFDLNLQGLQAVKKQLEEHGHIVDASAPESFSDVASSGSFSDVEAGSSRDGKSQQASDEGQAHSATSGSEGFEDAYEDVLREELGGDGEKGEGLHIDLDTVKNLVASADAEHGAQAGPGSLLLRSLGIGGAAFKPEH
jgi:hypothetical protein